MIWVHPYSMLTSAGEHVSYVCYLLHKGRKTETEERVHELLLIVPADLGGGGGLKRTTAKNSGHLSRTHFTDGCALTV
jgi:hypothetical protein